MFEKWMQKVRAANSNSNQNPGVNPDPNNLDPNNQKPNNQNPSATSQVNNLSNSPTGGLSGEETQKNPLDIYKEMFDTANNAKVEDAPAFSIDPEVIDKVSNGMDFTKGLDPELIQKALTGDVSAFMAVINAAGRQSYKASIEHNTKLTDTYLGARAKYDTTQVESRVKDALLTQTLSGFPTAQHPLVREELSRISKQMAKANPDASTEEIAKAAVSYFQELHNAIHPESKTPSNGPTDTNSVDWDKFW